ncbi:MAG TPA: copper homeostasis periplasmic binding protein CopC [Ideonella sp.]|uniref:copper homeostasis periplasmic binding protein CopC n=1 Tax=Ideonella sp. TaxID=1929293 RepID=UPI002C3A99F1|nr:copper homeostasis periplasmic binding protein CopC [Ideonella sp.]HSI47951.1 copper homeostasis periplasmic binding protein CopC [Ideonella sp.]
MKKLNMLGLVLAVAGAVSLPQLAQAHASLKNSAPAADSTVAAPKGIALTFNEKVEESFSAVTLKDAAGKEVSVSKPHVDTGDATTLRVDLPALSPGVYSVQWVAVGPDGHRRTGNFSFAVK